MSTANARRRASLLPIAKLGSHDEPAVHNRTVMHETFELIERARRRLREVDLQCAIAGPASEAEIVAAEEALGQTFPPSYRAFLRKVGAIALPARVSTVHQLVGLDGSGDDAGKSVVERTLHARVENRMADGLVIVGLGAEAGEWFCLDGSQVRADGEWPVMLFDARDNQLDQQFYDDFGQMLHEVMTFVLETLDDSFEHGASAKGQTSLRA